MVRTIYLSLFLLLSLAAGALYYSYTREATVVVATVDLQAGATVAESSVALRRVHPGSIPAGSARTMSDAVGKFVAWPIMEGQYIPVRALTRDRASIIAGGLQVPTGMHAISLPVVAAEAVGGTLRPGDLVDILAVPKNQAPGSSPAPATVLGRRVLVLGLRTEQGQPLDFGGGSSSARGLNPASNRLASIVLAIAPDDEEKYAAASAVSNFTIVLDLI